MDGLRLNLDARHTGTVARAGRSIGKLCAPRRKFPKGQAATGRTRATIWIMVHPASEVRRRLVQLPRIGMSGNGILRDTAGSRPMASAFSAQHTVSPLIVS